MTLSRRADNKKIPAVKNKRTIHNSQSWPWIPLIGPEKITNYFYLFSLKM